VVIAQEYFKTKTPIGETQWGLSSSIFISQGRVYINSSKSQAAK
jgi:hypothetical protein